MDSKSLKGLAVVLIVVLAIASLAVMPAMAEEEEIISEEEITPAPAERFLARVAHHLGVSVEDLKSAITAAKIEAINEAVEAGKITQEQADKITERVGEGEGFPRRRLPGRLRGDCAN
jgi:hypothetical protein